MFFRYYKELFFRNICVFAGPELASGPDTTTERIPGDLLPKVRKEFEASNYFTKLLDGDKSDVIRLLDGKEFQKYMQTDVYKEMTSQEQEKLQSIRKEFIGNANGIASISKSRNDIQKKLDVLLKKREAGEKVDKEIIDRLKAKVKRYSDQMLSLIMITDRLLNQARSLENRTERYAGLDNRYADLIKEGSKLTESERSIIDGRTDIAKLEAGDFYALRQENPKLLAELLLSKADGSAVSYESLLKNPPEGVVLNVNFGSNGALDSIVGAGDILPMRDVKEIEVNGVRGERRPSPRPGYYTPEGKYLAIHDGYKIKITKVERIEDNDEWEKYKVAAQERYEEMRGMQVISYIESELSNNVDTYKGEKKFPLPKFQSKTDKQLIENYLKRKIPEYMGASVQVPEKGVPYIELTGDHNWNEFAEAISGYRKVMMGVAKYLQEKDNLMSGTSLEFRLDEFEKLTGIPTKNQDFIKHAFESIANPDLKADDDTFPFEVSVKGGKISITIDAASGKKIQDVFGAFGQFLDFRNHPDRDKGEASFKNNNPSGITYNDTFAGTLRGRGVKFEMGRSRPAGEGGNYFMFPTIGEGIKAHNVLWDIKIRKFSGSTLGALLRTWAADASSYKKVLGDNLRNRNVGNIMRDDPKVFHKIQMKQLELESPLMYKALKEKGLLPYYTMIRA